MLLGPRMPEHRHPGFSILKLADWSGLVTRHPSGIKVLPGHHGNQISGYLLFINIKAKILLTHHRNRLALFYVFFLYFDNNIFDPLNFIGWAAYFF